jgi:hypothetical protein
MTKTTVGLVALLAALCVPAAAQDAKTVLATASKAMGSENLNAITYYGSGANFCLGQSNNSNGAWPRTNVNDYVRSIDFTQPASRATGVTFAAPVTGGPAAQAAFQQNITPANTAWAQQLEIWITPWGFLKGAAANIATAQPQLAGGRKYTVVTWMTSQKAPSGVPYKVVGDTGLPREHRPIEDRAREDPVRALAEPRPPRDESGHYEVIGPVISLSQVLAGS